MTTKINSFALGDDTVHTFHLNPAIFGGSSGEVVQGDTTLIVSTGGDLTGGGTITLGQGGTLNISYTQPTLVSTFTNDSGYLTSFTETDPTVPAHVKAITTTKISNWDTAYSWGDHSVEGYLTSETSHADVVIDGDFISQGIMLRGATSGSYAILTDNSANWNTAFGWGNHATQGYLTSSSNYYADSLGFNTSTGVLTLGMNGVSDLTVDLDGRYALTAGGQQDLDSVTTQGNTTTNDITVNGMTVNGDLTVSGTTTTVNSNTVNIGDNIILLNSDETGAPSQNGGIEIERGTSANKTLLWNETSDKWTVGSDTFVASTFEGDLTGNASTSSKWATARTITLGGDLSGSVSIDGSQGVTLTATVADDSHNHTISNVDGLQTAINDKLDSTANAVSASVWQTARTISLGGDLSGSVAIDGSTNVTLTATIGTNSVELGTDTTGNYVADAGVSGNGLSGSVSSEGGTFTVTSNATEANTANTIVYRDANGDFAAGTATLTATQAQYADLAEKYTVEFDHPTGTVMSVSYEVSLIDDGFETEPANSGDIPIGVVSDKPAFLMNETIDGQALALKGRVPVRVRGKVKKGEAVYADANGIASTHGVSVTGTNHHIVGVSLETNDTQAEKLVECVLKL